MSTGVWWAIACSLAASLSLWFGLEIHEKDRRTAWFLYLEALMLSILSIWVRSQ